METQKEYTSTLDSGDAFAVWVGCLGCYNNSNLNGVWVDARDAADLEAIGLAKIETVGDYTAPRCVRCFGDEFWVFDTDTNVSAFRSEMSPSEAAELARGLDDAINAGHDVEALNAWMNWSGVKDLSDLSEFEDSYQGHHEGGLVEFAQELAAELYGKELSEARWPFSCIDWEHAARELSYDYYEEGGHIFRAC
jgi:Antirestriction protein (ArdA)